MFNRFFNSEKSGGVILIICTAFSLILTNLNVDFYTDFWNISLAGRTLVQWINDGLMTIFFLLIGLELEREIYAGELSDFRNALLPVIAALGGMVVPAGMYLVFNFQGERSGAGIPMATDIAFALGVLAMLGKRVPVSLKIFLTALAVIDDLGAMIVIAVFYTSTFDLQAFGIAMAIFTGLLILNRLKVHNLLPYLAAGIFMWYYMLTSGIHPTIAGVLLAFAIPFGRGDEKSASYILQEVLHTPVAFFILPLFALANTCILINAEAVSALGSTVSLGIMTGLFVGKPLGIMLFTFLATFFKFSSLPPDVRWAHILGMGILAGIGFTMSIFISLLAFEEQSWIDVSKLSVMIASFSAGVIGFLWLKRMLPREPVIR